MWYVVDGGAATPVPAGAAGGENGAEFCRWRGGGLGSGGTLVKGVVVGKGKLDGGR